MANRLTEFLAEANRRRVFRTAGVYIVAVWGISQGAFEIGPHFGAPDWALRGGLIASIACLPLVLVLAWMFDIGRRGIVRDPADVDRQRNEDDAMASMPTMLGGDASQGAVIVRWADASGEQSAIFVEDFFLGRGSDCLVRFYDPLVSRRHARIYHADGGWHVEDLGSRNGTVVRGERVERSALASENSIRLNEAGPVLQLSLVAPGGDTQRALASYPPGQRVAHVRGASMDFDLTRSFNASKTE